MVDELAKETDIDIAGFITRTECATIHRSTRIITSIIISLFAIFILACGWALLRGYEAEQKADEIRTDFHIHEAQQVLSDQYTKDSLDRLEAGIEKVEAKVAGQHKMIEDIWKSNRNGNPK